jgi:hypothetical protein
VQPGPVGRWRGRRFAKAVKEQAAGVVIATEYYTQAAAFERARQGLVLAHQEAALLPLKLETQRQQLQGQLLQGQVHLDAMLQERQQAAELAAAEHQIELLNRKSEKLEAKARIKNAKRALKDAGKKKREAPVDDTPEEFRRHWQTEQRVRENRSEAQRRVAEIYDTARRERRNLSPDEIEEMDALADAAEAAEADVRRRAASGL